MLEKEYQYYNLHKDKLLKQYLGKFLLIRDEDVIDAYDSEKDAFIAAQGRGFEVGSFLIQECSPDSALKETFHSRVAFSPA